MYPFVFLLSKWSSLLVCLQCDQMALLFFNIGPFKKWKFAQKHINLPKLASNFAFRNCPKTCRILPNWRNFAKSGHTGTPKQSSIKSTKKWSDQKGLKASYEQSRECSLAYFVRGSMIVLDWIQQLCYVETIIIRFTGWLTPNQLNRRSVVPSVTRC